MGKQLWCMDEVEWISRIDSHVTKGHQALGTLANCCNQLTAWSPLSEAPNCPMQLMAGGRNEVICNSCLKVESLVIRLRVEMIMAIELAFFSEIFL